MSNEILQNPCPCFSGLAYKFCCAPFHKGDLPQNALSLMRSRYSAYALAISEYIVKTTHPDCIPHKEPTLWQREILSFCHHTQFLGLEIFEFEQRSQEAFVTFLAHLCQNGKDSSFVEKSAFEKVQDTWLYKKPLFLKPTN